MACKCGEGRRANVGTVHGSRQVKMVGHKCKMPPIILAMSLFYYIASLYLSFQLCSDTQSHNTTRESMPSQQNTQEETDANFPDQNVQRHSVTSLETARSLANDPSGGGLRGNSPGIAASPISLLSMEGVSGRSLTAGKILFTRRCTAHTIYYQLHAYIYIAIY